MISKRQVWVVWRALQAVLTVCKEWNKTMKQVLQEVRPLLWPPLVWVVFMNSLVWPADMKTGFCSFSMFLYCKSLVWHEFFLSLKRVDWWSGARFSSPETCRAHVRWHDSLCTFKTKALQGRKRCSYFYSIYNVLTPVSQMEVGCSRVWGLKPTTQIQVGGTRHKPALPANQPRTPPPTPTSEPNSSTRHTEQWVQWKKLLRRGPCSPE